MSSVVSASANEWRSFLADFGIFVQKFELVLSQLDLARTRIEGLRERTEQQEVRSGETLRQVEAALHRICDETEVELVESE